MTVFLGISIGVLVYTLFCVLIAFFLGWYEDDV